MWGVLAVAALAALALAANTGRQITGLALPSDTPAERAARLAPYWRLDLLPGPGPHPALALFSGCDGVRDNMARWAEAARGWGFATLIVDSHTPRGLDDLELWRLVCAGQQLTGAERAGDVAVALAHLRAQPGIDGDRLALLGASHGGWAVLDLLALAASDAPPPGLTDWPGGSPHAALSGVSAVVLLYPYCGIASRVAKAGWTWDAPVAMLLVDGDTITGDAPCRDLAARMTQAGRAVQVEGFAGVTHGFDQQDRSTLSPLAFDAAATLRALDLGRAVLAPLASR